MIFRKVLSQCYSRVAHFIFLFKEWQLYWKDFISFRGHIYVDISIPYCIKDNYNWGDDVNRVLVEYISGKRVIPSRCMIMKGKHYLCIGSIIQWYSDNNAIIWGSGLLTHSQIKGIRKVYAVRGPLTRAELLKQGYDCPEIYGDPVLLFPRFYNPTIHKTHKIGIIAHFYELHSPIIQQLINKYNLFFIDIQHYGRWNSFIDKVLSCNYIISSSLHGCIVSDAYRVPNMWCQFTDYVAEDSGFKFHDYYLSLGKNIASPYNMLINAPSENELTSIIDCQWTAPCIDLDLLMEVCPFRRE